MKEKRFCIDCNKEIYNQKPCLRCKSCNMKNHWKTGVVTAKGNSKIEFQLASFNCVFNVFKHGAKKREHDFSLSKEEFRKLTSQSCIYCGKLPEQCFKCHEGELNGVYKYNGLDRVNSDLGYTIKNSVPCCGICNRAKNTLTVNEFLSHIKRIYEYNQK